MGPISSYKELIQALSWDTEKRTKERWYIFLLMNPRNQTNAGIEIIKNFLYLDVRTGNVTFFLPGFSNLAEGVVPYCSNNGREVVYQDSSFGELYFDERGFLDTINWLEQGCYSYKYSEDLDLVIIRYRPIYADRYQPIKYEKNFKLSKIEYSNRNDLKLKMENNKYNIKYLYIKYLDKIIYF